MRSLLGWERESCVRIRAGGEGAVLAGRETTEKQLGDNNKDTTFPSYPPNPQILRTYSRLMQA